MRFCTSHRRAVLRTLFPSTRQCRMMPTLSGATQMSVLNGFRGGSALSAFVPLDAALTVVPRLNHRGPATVADRFGPCLSAGMSR